MLCILLFYVIFVSLLKGPLEASANEGTLLRKQNCVQDAKMFLKNLKSILCFQDANFVSLVGANEESFGKHRRNIDFGSFPIVSSFAYQSNVF